MIDNPKVSLGKPRREPDWSWHSDPVFARKPIRVTRTFSRWRSKQGWRIHRARFATISRTTARLHITFWCNQMAFDPIPFREECAEGTSPCGRCEGLYSEHLRQNGGAR